MIYELLNYFFFVFHTLLIFFNSFGWIIKKFRRANLLTLLLTAGSWFILGIWYGWGYCACTDWHWMVRRHLGYHDISSSYNHLLILKLTGINFNQSVVDMVTVIVFALSIVLSCFFNWRDFRRKKIN